MSILTEAQKNSVLIVDDESLNITALSHILSPYYTVYVEKDGQGCIDSARELKPDLILLDIIMPGMNGFDVIKVLKEDEDTSHIPVVFVTGLNNSKDEELSFSLGAADYISKPFSAPVVKLRVKNQMQIVNHMRSIKRLSVTDILTGINSRRHFNTLLNQEWRKALRDKQSLGFMIIDINNFEAYNARYGHLRGDIVLKEVAQMIDAKVAGTPYQISRWGGEEFAIVLPGMELDGVRTFATDIEATINAKDFVRDGVPSNISVSIGIHGVSQGEAQLQGLDAFVSSTTEALNFSKTKTRDRVSSVQDIANSAQS